MQLKEIKFPYAFTESDIRTLVARKTLESLWLRIQLKALSVETIRCIFRSQLQDLIISSPTISITYERDEAGVKVITIREKATTLMNIAELIDSSISSSACFRVFHSLVDGTKEFEMTCTSISSQKREVEISSSSWTNENFGDFIAKLCLAYSCSSLRVDVDKLVATPDILTRISYRFPNLERLELIVCQFVQSHVNLFLAMRKLVSITIIAKTRNVAACPSELEGLALIEEIEQAVQLSAATVATVPSYSSSSRPYLLFDVPGYNADAIFFFSLSMRNPYLEKIDISICNFYGRNLAPLQDLKNLKEVRLCISSNLALAVEMVGSILTGFKNRELLFCLTTNLRRNEVLAEIQDFKLQKISITQEMDWESTQSNNWPRLLSQFSSLVELELNGVGCGHKVISKNRRLRNLTWDRLDDEALISFAESLPSLEYVSCFDNTSVTTNGILSLLRGKARESLRRIDLPMTDMRLDANQLFDEVKTIQNVTNRKLLLFIGE